METGAELARAAVDAADAPDYAAGSSADGTKVAFATSRRIHVWLIDRGEILHAATTLYAKDPRFSADGCWLLAADEDVARIWDTTTMQELAAFPLHFASVVSVDISPDKKIAASYGLDSTARLWETLSGREITNWKLPRRDHSPRWQLRFSEDGKSLWHGSGYGSERLIVDLEPLIFLAKSRVFRELNLDERRLFLRDQEKWVPFQ